jgi:hypothetical protein
MIKTTIIILLLTSQFSFAALPPQNQNWKDLNVMITFIKEHEKIMATLELIDLENYVVHFSGNCKAIFARKITPKPSGWVGPADPLVFRNSNCSLE